MIKKLRQRWRKWRYAVMCRKAPKLASPVIGELKSKIAALQEELDAERVTIRILKTTIEQQQWVIERDRQRVKKEIADFGGNIKDIQGDDSSLRVSGYPHV